MELGLYLEPRLHLVARLYVEQELHMVEWLHLESRLHLEPHAALVERPSDVGFAGKPVVHCFVDTERVVGV